MTPYVGEIRMFAGNFAPAGWALCNGQTMPISENDVLFQLIGTTYGGDGEENFNLPNLQSRFPMHMGTGPDGTTYQIGEMAGVEQVTLASQQIPAHSHSPVANKSPGKAASPSGAILSEPSSSQAGVNAYGLDTPLAPMNAQALTSVGGSQPHENMQPFLCFNFIISLYGIFPSQT